MSRIYPVSLFALSFFNYIYKKITYICMYKYIYTTPKKNFEMTRQDFCALQDKKGDLEMCRASVLHARCSMRIFLRKAEKKEERADHSGSSIELIIQRKKNSHLLFNIYSLSETLKSFRCLFSELKRNGTLHLPSCNLLRNQNDIILIHNIRQLNQACTLQK